MPCATGSQTSRRGIIPSVTGTNISVIWKGNVTELHLTYLTSGPCIAGSGTSEVAR